MDDGDIPGFSTFNCDDDILVGFPGCSFKDEHVLVIPVTSREYAQLASQAILRESVVGFDCKGNNLSRHGSLELITVCLPPPSHGLTPCAVVYVFDMQALGGFDGTGLLDVVQSESVWKVVYDLRNDLDALFQYPVRSFIDTSVIGLVAREECYHTRCDHFFSIDQMFNDICGSTAFTFHVASGGHFYPRSYDKHPINTCDIKLGRKDVQAWKDEMRPYMQADTERKIWTSRPLSSRNIAYAGLNALLSYAMWESTAMKWGLSIGQGGDLHGSSKIVTKIVTGTKWMSDCYREKIASRATSAYVPRGLQVAMRGLGHARKVS